jgi:hypothetical protein
MRRLAVLASLLLAALLVIPAVAFAGAVPAPQHTLALPTDQIWTIVAASVAPLAGYIVNYLGPHSSERIKAVVQLVAAAIAGGLTQAITAGDVGLNAITLQFVVTAVIAAFGAHKLLWQPSTIGHAFGAGRNRA